MNTYTRPVAIEINGAVMYADTGERTGEIVTSFDGQVFRHQCDICSSYWATPLDTVEDVYSVCPFCYPYATK